jgi:hypothetical protein
MDNGLKVAACDYSESNRLQLAVAALPIDVGDVVALVNGQWTTAISVVWAAGVGSSVTRMDAVGIAVERAMPGQYLRPVKRAHISGLSGLTSGGRVYLSTSVYGSYTQTKPYAVYVQQDIGAAVSTTEILFDIDARNAKASIDDIAIDGTVHVGYGASTIAANTICGVNSTGKIVAAAGVSTTAVPAVGLLVSGVSTTATGSLKISCVSIGSVTAGKRVFLGSASGVSTGALSLTGDVIQTVGVALTSADILVKPNLSDATLGA